MAHDPTRSWPTGKGPDDTSIPGAAWLELLDGQAFPVVGAGAMVRDGNAWTPASSSNPLHVRAQALEQLIGTLNANKETNPDAASASMLSLLRGLIAIVGKEATLGQILAALGAPAQESTLVDVLAALTTLAGTIDSGAQKVTLTGSKLARVATQLPGNTTSGSPTRNVNFINTIAAATTVIIRDTTSPVIIESLYLLHGDFFTFSDLRVHFYLRDSGGNLRFVPVFGHDDPSNDGGFTPQYFSPERLKNAGGKSNLWELVAWNAGGGSADYSQVIWRMLTPITALHGYRLVAENVNQTNSILVRFQVDIREVLLS